MPKPRRIALMMELEWPYERHTTVFAGTQQYAQKQGWESIVDEHAYETLSARKSGSVRYDGIIARATKPLAERAARAGVPVVNTWFSSPARDLLPGVFSDFEASARLRAEHLLSRGLRNFGSLWCRADLSHDVEVREFRRVVGEAGCACSTAKVPLNWSQPLANWHKTERAVATWMNTWQRPIGVFVAGDALGRIVVQMCRERGWRVPEDVAMVAGTNEETFCERPPPSITSIEFGYQRIGYEAARLLDRLMDAKTRGKKKRRRTTPEHILVPPVGLVLRESTDFYAVDEPSVAAALAFIGANSYREIHPPAVARAVKVELRTLQRRFLKHVGRSIVEEVRRVRVERARRELAFTDQPIGAIAIAVGFTTPKLMYETFLRDLGVTPTEYRRKRQEL